MSDNDTKQNIEKKDNFIISQTPTSATDSFAVGHRGDGSLLIRLASAMPDNVIIENHRTIISEDAAKELINILTEVMNYYPKKPIVKKKIVTK